MVYHGPRAMEELFRYDPQLVIGILGGSAGTTLDAFQLLADAQKYGAKVALFGRKINSAENQLAFVQFLRLIVDGVIGPVDAVKAYHAVLGKLGDQAPPPARGRPEAPGHEHELRRDVDERGRPRQARAVVERPRLRLPSHDAPGEGRGPRLQVPRRAEGQGPGRDHLDRAPTSRNGFPPSPTAIPTSPGWTSPSASPTTASGSGSGDDGRRILNRGCRASRGYRP